MCDRLELDPRTEGRTVTNPVLLIEVLSPSTDLRSRQELEHYRPDPTRCRGAARRVTTAAEADRRGGAATTSGRHAAGPGETATLASIGCALAVDDTSYDPLGGDGA